MGNFFLENGPPNQWRGPRSKLYVPLAPPPPPWALASEDLAFQAGMDWLKFFKNLTFCKTLLSPVGMDLGGHLVTMRVPMGSHEVAARHG